MSLELQNEQRALTTTRSGATVKPWKIEDILALFGNTNLLILSDNYPERKKRLEELLEPVNLSSREKFSDQIGEAYGIFRMMSADDQTQFAKDRPDLIDVLFGGLSLKQIHDASGGMITGMSTDISKPVGKDNKKVYSNPVLALLDNPSTYFPENADLLLLLEEMIAQVDASIDEELIKKDQATNQFSTVPDADELTKKKLFREEADAILIKHKHSNTVKQDIDAYAEERKMPDDYESLWYLKILSNATKRTHPGEGFSNFFRNVGAAVNGLFVFTSRFGGKQVLKNISLYDAQRLTTWGGHFYGFEFAEGANADVDLDLKNGAFKLDAATLPVMGLNYFAPNYSIRSDDGFINDLHLAMDWPTNKKNSANDVEEKKIQKNDIVTANISIGEQTKANATLNNLRYFSRDSGGKQSGIAMSKLEIKGLKITGITRKNTAKVFRKGSDVLSEVIYGLMDSSFILTYAVMSVIDQMVYSYDKYPMASLDEFKANFINSLSSSLGITLEFDELRIRNLVHSDYGLIRDITIGHSTYSLTQQVNSIKDNNTELEHLNKVSEIKSLEKEKAKLSAKRAKHVRKKHKGNRHENKVTSLDAEIELLDDKINSLKKEIAVLGAGSTYDVKFQTDGAVELKDAYIAEQKFLAASAIDELLKTYMVTNLHGIDDINLSKGFTMSSTIGFELNADKTDTSGTLTDTILDIPEFEVPLITADSLGINTSAIAIQGGDTIISGLKGKLRMKWSPINELTKDQENKPSFELLELTDGSVLVMGLSIQDKNSPDRSIEIAGQVTLSHLYMKFPYVNEDNFVNFIFGCQQIVASDINALELLSKDEKVGGDNALAFWFRETSGSYIILNGFEFGSLKPLVTQPASQGVLRKEVDQSYLLINTGKFKNIGVDQASITTDLTHFSCFIKDTTETKIDDHDFLNPITSKEREYTIRVGLTEFDVPKMKLENDKFRLSYAGYDQTLSELQKNISDIKAVIQDVTKSKARQVEKTKALQHYRYILSLYNKALSNVGDGKKARLTGIDADIRIVMNSPNSGEQMKFKALYLDCLYINKVDANNISFTKKGDVPSLPIYLMGENAIDGLHVANAYYKSEGSEIGLDTGGVVSGNKIAITQLISSVVGLNAFGTGEFSVSRLDDGTYSYSVDDLHGRYSVHTKIDGKQIDISGNQREDVDIDFTDLDDGKGTRTMTIDTAGNLYVPEIIYDDLILSASTGHIRLKDIHGTIEAHYVEVEKEGKKEKKYTDIVIKELNIARLGVKGAHIKYGDEIDVHTSLKEENYIENVKFTDVKYDLTKPLSTAITGSISTGSVDLSHIEDLTTSVLELCRGGIKASKMSFSRSANGKTTFTVSDPKIIAESLTISKDGFTLSLGSEYEDLTELISAEEVTYSNRDEQGITGHFITFINPYFHHLKLGGMVIIPPVKKKKGADDAYLKIDEIILDGHCEGELEVNVYDDAFVINAIGAEFSIDSIELSTPDFDQLTENQPKEEKVPEKSVFEKTLEKELAKILIPDGNGGTRPITLEEFHTIIFRDDFARMSEVDLNKIPEMDETGAGGTGVEATRRAKMMIDRYGFKKPETKHVKTADEILVEKLRYAHQVATYAQYLDEQARARAQQKRERTNFNFLNSTIDGYAAVSIFGKPSELQLTRIQDGLPFNIREEQLAGWPADPVAENASGKTYSTFINIAQFLHDFTSTMSKNIGYWTWLNSVAGTDEIHADVEEGEYKLIVDAVSSLYVATLLSQISADNFKQVQIKQELFRVPGNVVKVIKDVFGLNDPAIFRVIGLPVPTETPDFVVNLFWYQHWAKLSDVAATLAYKQSPSSLMGGDESTSIMFVLADILMKGDLTRLKNDATERVLRHVFTLMHENLDPQIILQNATIDLKGKTNEQKGLLSFVQPAEGDAPIKTSAQIYLNQTKRIDLPGTENDRKKLGIQFSFTDFNMPGFVFGKEKSEKDERQLYVAGKGVSFKKLDFGLEQTNYERFKVEYPLTTIIPDKNRALIPELNKTIDKTAKLKGEGIKMKGFKMQLPRKKVESKKAKGKHGK